MATCRTIPGSQKVQSQKTNSQVAGGLEKEPYQRHQVELFRLSDQARQDELQAGKHRGAREAMGVLPPVGTTGGRHGPPVPPLKKPADSSGMIALMR